MLKSILLTSITILMWMAGVLLLVYVSVCVGVMAGRLVGGELVGIPVAIVVFVLLCVTVGEVLNRCAR